MKLHVTIAGSTSGITGVTDVDVNQFSDLDKIAGRVARIVKAYLRQVPVRKQFSRATFTVTAQYSEAVPKAKPARKHKTKGEPEEARAAVA